MILQTHNDAGEVAYTSVAYGYFCGSFAVRMILVDPAKQAFVLLDEYDANAHCLNARVMSYVNMNFDGWVMRNRTDCKPLVTTVRQAGGELELDQFFGYREVWADQALLCRLLCGEAVPISEVDFPLRDEAEFPAWQSLRTQADADMFQNIFGFHDSAIDRVTYEETYEDGCRVLMTLDMTCWLGCRMDFCFEDVTEVHLHANLPRYSREIYGATLRIEKDGVFWADEELSDRDINQPLPDWAKNVIRARSVKVRICEDPEPIRGWQEWVF